MVAAPSWSCALLSLLKPSSSPDWVGLGGVASRYADSLSSSVLSQLCPMALSSLCLSLTEVPDHGGGIVVVDIRD